MRNRAWSMERTYAPEQSACCSSGLCMPPGAAVLRMRHPAMITRAWFSPAPSGLNLQNRDRPRYDNQMRQLVQKLPAQVGRAFLNFGHTPSGFGAVAAALLVCVTDAAAPDAVSSPGPGSSGERAPPRRRSEPESWAAREPDRNQPPGLRGLALTTADSARAPSCRCTEPGCGALQLQCLHLRRLYAELVALRHEIFSAIGG